jgi:SPX domain protein involved in polyphosphate accumulation
MERQEDARYELKMVFENQRLAEVRSWVRCHSHAFRTTYPNRQVNNIYLDTDGMGCWNDHLDGIPARRKLRYRWYGPEWRQGCGQMEVKEKNERSGWKLIQQMKTPIDLRALSWNQVMAILRGEAEGVIREMLLVSRPVLLYHYQREYYETGDGAVRLTLDYQMVVYDQLFNSRPNLSFRSPGLDLMVIEIKSLVDNAPLMAEILAEFPLRVEAHSKYVGALSGMLSY